MAIISLGTVTIVAMFLWVLVCLAEVITTVQHAKVGLAVAYVVAVAWQFGVTI